MAPEPADDPRLKRLRYRAWHRGFREADLILGPFADAHAGKLDAGQLDRLERLLEAPDHDLYEWITGKSAPPPEHDSDVLGLIKDFRFFARAARTQAGA